MDHAYVRQIVDVLTDEGLIHTRVVYRETALSAPSRRVVMMIAGTLANGAQYFDVASGTGFAAAELIADAGYIAVLPDPPGTGRSSRPAHGRDADAAMAARALTQLGAWAMTTYGVSDGVDVYGEAGSGTSVALLLARESWVRSVTLSGPTHLQFGPATAMLFTPGYAELLASLPDGYVPQNPMQIGLFLGAADALIRDLAVMACMGPPPQTLAAGRFYDVVLRAGPDAAASLRLAEPVAAAEPARAPALVLHGSPDFVGSDAGTEELVASYGETGGGKAQLVVIPGASHVMRFDHAVANGPTSPFWSAFLGFLRTH